MPHARPGDRVRPHEAPTARQKETVMKKTTLAALLLVAPWLVPHAAHAGANCRAFGTTGYVGNWHNMIDQSDATLKSVVGLGGNLCGPAAAAHVLAGYDD